MKMVIMLGCFLALLASSNAFEDPRHKNSMQNRTPKFIKEKLALVDHASLINSRQLSPSDVTSGEPHEHASLLQMSTTDDKPKFKLPIPVPGGGGKKTDDNTAEGNNLNNKKNLKEEMEKASASQKEENQDKKYEQDPAFNGGINQEQQNGQQGQNPEIQGATVVTPSGESRVPYTVAPANVANANAADHKPMGKVPRIKCYVINIDTQPDRLNDFMGWWRSAWPELEIERISAIMEPKRGHGITKSFVKAMNKAIDDNVDVALFMEDDAKPFEEVRWPADFYTLLDNTPTDATVLALGGHHITAQESPNFSKLVTKVSKTYGAYSWAIRKDQMPRLRNFWQDLADQDLESYNCDEDWHQLFTEQHPAYMSTPLLVDHYGVYSNTWGMLRSEVNNGGDVWQGHRDWWNFPSQW